MYVAVIPNRGSPPAILLRESYREAGKTRNRTLANLSGWPAERIEQLRAVLRGDKLLPAAEAVEIVRARPHGHVLAALGTARRIAGRGAAAPGAATPPRSCGTVGPRPNCRKDSPAAALRLPRRASPPHWPFHLGQAYRVRSRLSAGGRWIRTSGSAASGEADAILPVKDRPR